MPRCSGKTTNAVNKFEESPDNSILVVRTEQLAAELRKSVGIKTENIISSIALLKMKDWELDGVNLIMDDYLSFNDLPYLHSKITESCRLNRIDIFTTPSKIYDRKLFEFIKKFKQGTIPCIDSACMVGYIEQLMGNRKDDECSIIPSNNEFEELFYNLITDPDCRLYKEEADYSPETKSSLYQSMSKEQYKIQVNCMFLTDEE